MTVKVKAPRPMTREQKRMQETLRKRNARIYRLEVELRETAAMLHKFAAENGELGVTPSERGKRILDRTRSAHKALGICR